MFYSCPLLQINNINNPLYDAEKIQIQCKHSLSSIYSMKKKATLLENASQIDSNKVSNYKLWHILSKCYIDYISICLRIELDYVYGFKLRLVTIQLQTETNLGQERCVYSATNQITKFSIWSTHVPILIIHSHWKSKQALSEVTFHPIKCIRFVGPWVAGNDLIVKSINVNIPVSL